MPGSSVMAIAYDSRLRTAVGPAGGFLPVTDEGFCGALEVAVALTLGAAVSFVVLEATDAFLAGVVPVSSPFCWGGVANDFDLLLLTDEELGLGLVALKTFLSALILLGAPPAAEALDVPAFLAAEEAVLVLGAEAGLPPVADFVDRAAFLVVDEAVLVLVPEGRLPPVADDVALAASLAEDEVVLALVAEAGLPSAADVLALAASLAEDEVVLALVAEAGLPSAADVLALAASLAEDEAVLVLGAVAGLPVEPLEVVDAAELGRLLEDPVRAGREVPDEDFREVAEVALRESCDLWLAVLPLDETRLNPTLVVPTVVFSVPAVLLPVFTTAALVGVEDLEDVDVAGDFTRLITGGLGSYMLVRRPLIAAAFCAVSSSTGLSHFTTLALGPTTFPIVSGFGIGPLFTSFFSMSFLPPSLPCLIELGWISGAPVESSKSPALRVFGSPPTSDSRLAEESIPKLTLAEGCRSGETESFTSGSVSASTFSLLLFRSLLKKFGSFAEILFDCFLEGLSAFVPSTGLLTVGEVAEEADPLPSFCSES